MSAVTGHASKAVSMPNSVSYHCTIVFNGRNKRDLAFLHQSGILALWWGSVVALCRPIEH